MSQEVFEALTQALERGEDAALVTIVSANGSTPQRVGAKMLVFPDGRTVGTIGGGCYENDAFWKAKESIQSRKPALIKYDLNDDFAQENGLVCGGQMQVYIEPLEATPRLYVIGAGHVGYHLARLAHTIGFRTHVLDDREKFASKERFPDAEEVIVETIPEWLHRADLPTSAYVVIVTRGHTHDLDALRALAARDLRYLGLIGSKAKVKRIYDALLAEGMPPECLQRVNAPVGLDIGAVSPEEIAVAILAELIAVRRGQDPGSQAGRRLDALGSRICEIGALVFAVYFGRKACGPQPGRLSSYAIIGPSTLVTRLLNNVAAFTQSGAGSRRARCRIYRHRRAGRIRAPDARGRSGCVFGHHPQHARRARGSRIPAAAAYVRRPHPDRSRLPLLRRSAARRTALGAQRRRGRGPAAARRRHAGAGRRCPGRGLAGPLARLTARRVRAADVAPTASSKRSNSFR